jgi:hypothetical protein
MMRVEFGIARHVIPPSVEVERDVVAEASSDVMGRVGVGVIGKLAVMTTRPGPLFESAVFD